MLLVVSLLLGLKQTTVVSLQLHFPHLYRAQEHCRHIEDISNSRLLEGNVNHEYFDLAVKRGSIDGLAYPRPKPTNWRLGHIADALQNRLALDRDIRHPTSRKKASG